MNLFRTDSNIIVNPVEVLENGDWKKTHLHSTGGMILTDLSENDHDLLVGFHQNYDPDCLKGLVVTLHLKNKTDDDPDTLNVIALPQRGHILRHQDRYYIVKFVVQSSSGSAAVFAERLLVNDLWALDEVVQLSR